MKKFTVATFLLIFLFSGLSSGAQNPDSHFSEFAKRFTTEKTHIHYDKATYYPGETIWFKAYLMEGIYPAGQTKTLAPNAFKYAIFSSFVLSETAKIHL